jgi:hypothetical protein
MSNTRDKIHDWNDDDDDDAPTPPRTGVAWWKRVLVWLPAGIGVWIVLVGLSQFLPLLPMLVTPDDRAGGAGPALSLVLFGSVLFGIALLIRRALGGRPSPP